MTALVTKGPSSRATSVAVVEQAVAFDGRNAGSSSHEGRLPWPRSPHRSRSRNPLRSSRRPGSRCPSGRPPRFGRSDPPLPRFGRPPWSPRPRSARSSRRADRSWRPSSGVEEVTGLILPNRARARSFGPELRSGRSSYSGLLSHSRSLRYSGAVDQFGACAAAAGEPSPAVGLWRERVEGHLGGWPSTGVVSGGVLLSHTLAGAVPSALVGLASGFGMFPGVSPPLWPP